MSRRNAFFGIGLLVTLLLAGVVSYYASSRPDGFDRVAIDQGLDRDEQDHQLKSSPLADYATKGVEDKRLSGGIAGVAGVAITLVLSGGLAFALRRRTHDERT